MTDNSANSPINSWLPLEVWSLITSFLDSDELASFRQVCQSFYGIGSRDMILQPLYNRLRTIDNTLPAELQTAANAALKTPLVFFKEAFEKIQARQQQEITYLTQHHPDLMTKPEYAAALEQNTPISLKSLATKNAVLDAINSDIITNRINVNSNNWLILSNTNITRLPVTLFQAAGYTNFWQKLTHLLCDKNQLTELNLQKLITLQVLNCQENQLETLNLQGLSALTTLYFDRSPRIPYVNLTGAHPNLQSYFFSDAKLKSSDNISNFFEKRAKIFLFGVLGSSDSLEERQEAITKLGPYYTYKNCLNCCPGYADKLFVSDSMSMLSDVTSCALRQFSNYVPLSIANRNATATPSNDVQMTQEKELDNKPEDTHRKNN